MTTPDNTEQELDEILSAVLRDITFRSDGRIHPKLVDAFLTWHNSQAERREVALLESLHRYEGEGLPKRDFDNLTDEHIDDLLDEHRRAQLTSKKEQPRPTKLRNDTQCAEGLSQSPGIPTVGKY